MTNFEVRKIGQLGNGSFYFTLPKSYVSKWSLIKGDEVFLKLDSSNLLVSKQPFQSTIQGTKRVDCVRDFLKEYRQGDDEIVYNGRTVDDLVTALPDLISDNKKYLVSRYKQIKINYFLKKSFLSIIALCKHDLAEVERRKLKINSYANSSIAIRLLYQENVLPVKKTIKWYCVALNLIQLSSQITLLKKPKVSLVLKEIYGAIWAKKKINYVGYDFTSMPIALQNFLEEIYLVL